MKALLHFRASHRLRERLAAITEPAVAIVDPQDEAGFAGERMDAEVLLHVLTPVTAAMIAAMPRLRLIQKIGVGVNTIDRAAGLPWMLTRRSPSISLAGTPRVLAAAGLGA